MSKLFGTTARASALRTLLRSVLVVATSFGLKLTAEQVAAIQLGVEALLQFGAAWYTKGI